MKDRKNRSFIMRRGALIFWCTLIILLLFGFTSSTLRLFSTQEGSYPRLVSKWNIPAMEVMSGENPVDQTIMIRETVIFPDEALIFLKYPPSTALFTKDDLNCIYSPTKSSWYPQPKLELSPSSVEQGSYENQQIVRCPIHPRGAIVSLSIKHNGNNLSPGPTYRWNSLAYEAMIDQQDNSTVVFVKGLNLGSGKSVDPSRFKCIYGSDLTTKSNPALWTHAISVAQEIVRCRTPLSVLQSTSNDPIKVSVRVVGRKTLDSVARVNNHHHHHQKAPKHKKEHKLCVCTMLRNQARFLPEWITYHASITGVQNWFLYDNNSDDEIEQVIESMIRANHNVTRVMWPWVKSQEAGFAHCALRARDSCEWVGFIDVDEFLHFPSNLSLHDVIDNQSKYSSSSDQQVGEIRVSCHNFGPSGLKEMPAKGVTVGYTCRMGAPERHKSIVRPEALNSTLINFVHHFDLKAGFVHVNLNRREVVINHYKYQVWSVFKEKFYRRVAAYVSDWQEETNVGSKDRTPGLGTKAVEPADWTDRFCEVNDIGLRNRVLETFADPKTGLLPWEHIQLDENIET